MKRLFIGLAMLLGLTTIGLGAPRSAAAATGAWQKSVAIQSRSSSDFASSSFNQSVDKALASGVNTVVLIIPIHQSNIYSTDVQTGNDTPTDAAITSAVRYIHAKGGRAVISMHLNPYDNQWRAMINPDNRGAWFYNYGAQLNHYAALAQSTGAEQMVLGTELSHMTSAEFNQSNTAYWTTMIQNVRSIYSGSLTYSAQHDGYMSDLAGIGFWSKLDYIGISAYYGMGYDSSVAALEAKWSQYDNQYIRPVASKYNKQVLFTEIGYASKTNTLADPGTAYQAGGGYDPSSQANAYQALFDYWSNAGYFAGVTLWDWSSDPSAGGSGNTDYTPQNKPAQDVMKRYFGSIVGSGSSGGNSSSGGTGAVTPPATPSASSYSLTAANGSGTRGAPVTAAIAVQANGVANNTIVDLEVYDQNGNRVAQKYFDNQNLSTSSSSYSVSWTPSASGVYTLKGGVFTSNWSASLAWNNGISTVQVSEPASAQPPASTTPPTTAPVTPPPSSSSPAPAPTQPTPSPTPAPLPSPAVPTTANLSIWWPSNGAGVSGVQPFKAVLDGIDPRSYAMYWQVDGGGLNAMADSTTDGAHKEALVNVSLWNWQPNRKYIVNFVAKDATGAVIAQKSTAITVYN